MPLDKHLPVLKEANEDRDEAAPDSIILKALDSQSSISSVKCLGPVAQSSNDSSMFPSGGAIKDTENSIHHLDKNIQPFLAAKMQLNKS